MNPDSQVAAAAGQSEVDPPIPVARDLRREFAAAMRKCTPKQRQWLRKLPEHNFQLWGVARTSLGLSTNSIFKWLREDRIKVARALQDEIATEDYEITQRRILAEYTRIAFSDLRQAFDETGKLKRPSEWPDELAGAVAGIDTQEKRLKEEGEWIDEFEMVRKLKVHDKLKALEFLADFKGMIGAKKIELTGKNGVPFAAPTIFIGGPGEPGEPDGTDAG